MNEQTATHAGKRRSLTAHVQAVLRERIAGGTIRPGDRLPTEKALIEEFGVSRTVIREAVARLAADGLVEPRQGAGVFVLEPPKTEAGALSLLSADSGKISSILEALELRTAVEIEAAGLAAERCSPAQEAKIGEALDEIDAAVARGESATAVDFAFHLAIAEATNNRYYWEFLEFLGNRTIPRAQFARKDGSAPVPMATLRQFQAEHRHIAEAIAARDPDRARDAMRLHLRGSLERYRALIRRKD
ncbi:FadR family transcriptional regulator [Kaustia mangrovi]|uniref:FadR family transcriptional regulator n=1 Tax=Kaustia mangrovi TaxID=2593653 RepID=A0A7S8C120_9HYPH|nr:FadR/GntR family transcriptional regulator [Kaustia mangrovi]QPC41391.1 FadR family transcriptional regulator [Kaustia mangrovi]